MQNIVIVIAQTLWFQTRRFLSCFPNNLCETCGVKVFWPQGHNLNKLVEVHWMKLYIPTNNNLGLEDVSMFSKYKPINILVKSSNWPLAFY